MKFINIRELSQSTSKYVKMANEEDDVIVTRNGHPYAIMQRINDDELEDYILARNLNLSREFRLAQKAHEKGENINARCLLDELDNE